MNPSLTILVPTYNRADSLRETLEAMTSMDMSGLDAEVVVIDNNSTDATKPVVQSFSGRLPVRYRFEPRQGKSQALNKALDELRLRELVVFTDDDVSPDPDWLQCIAGSARRWPDYSLFGGYVDPSWPDGQPPVGLRCPGAHMWGFGVHGYGSDERPYPSGITPVGMNWWARREVLQGGRRFDESIGPKGRSVIMGEDTLFLHRLLIEGYTIIHVPGARIRHRIEPERLTDRQLCKRAYAMGRGGIHCEQSDELTRLLTHPIRWRVRRMASLGHDCLKYLLSHIWPDRDKAAQMRYEAMEGIGYNTEALRMTGQMLRSTSKDSRNSPCSAACSGDRLGT